MKMLIQADEKGLPHHFDAACAMFGAIDQEWAYDLVRYDDLSPAALCGCVPVGTVEFMRRAFDLLGVEHPRLPRNSDRTCEEMTLGAALQLREYTGWNIFLKPKEIKVFTGFVHEGYAYSALDGISLDTEVLVYDVFSSPIASEWRVYIYEGEVLDAKNYAGDFLLTPSRQFIDRAIEKSRPDFPGTYSMDIGILASGENVVIEFNDFWALGNYGVPNWLYAKALAKRHMDIVSSHPLS